MEINKKEALIKYYLKKSVSSLGGGGASVGERAPVLLSLIKLS